MAMAMAMALANPSMALPLRSPLHRKHAFINNANHNILRFSTYTKLPSFLYNSSPNCRLNSFSALKSASVNGFSVHNSNLEGSENDQVEFPERLRELVHFIRSIWPGGSWWSLSDHADVIMTAKPVTVLRALQRMWDLVAKDRWIIFAAFSALFLAAVSEVSIPHFLTASIFSAQSREIVVFHRNVGLLVFLCFASGIFRLKFCMVKVLRFS